MYSIIAQIVYRPKIIKNTMWDVIRPSFKGFSGTGWRGRFEKQPGVVSCGNMGKGFRGKYAPRQ